MREGEPEAPATEKAPHIEEPPAPDGQDGGLPPARAAAAGAERKLWPEPPTEPSPPADAGTLRSGLTTQPLRPGTVPVLPREEDAVLAPAATTTASTARSTAAAPPRPIGTPGGVVPDTEDPRLETGGLADWRQRPPAEAGGLFVPWARRRVGATFSRLQPVVS